MSDSATPWTAARQDYLSITNSPSLLKLMSSESVMPSNHLILLSPSLPAFSLSQHQGLFPMSWFFKTGGQSIGASASASVLPMNIQGWFLLRLTGLISFQSMGLLRAFSNTPHFESINSTALFMAQLSHPYMTTGKTIALTIQTFVSKVMSLLFNMLSRSA